MKLKDKVAIITGATSGIGAKISETFIENGAKVLIIARHKNEELIKNLGKNAKFFSADITDENSVKEIYKFAIKSFGKIDILVNNAGITGPTKPSFELNFDEWSEVINLNINGTFLMSKYALLEMIKQKSGNIVNIASILGMVASEAFSVYSTSKGAIIAMTKQDALSVAKFNVRVNSISPGTVKTNVVANLEKQIGNEAFDEMFNKPHPLGGVGSVEDVANAALFLASDEARWITGANLVVDGGFTIKWVYSYYRKFVVFIIKFQAVFYNAFSIYNLSINNVINFLGLSISKLKFYKKYSLIS